MDLARTICTSLGAVSAFSTKTVLKSGKPTGSKNYLADYSVALAPEDADVAWGSVEWETDPFDGLTCEGSDPISAMEAMSMDVCELFAEEVDMALSSGYKTDAIIISGVEDGTPTLGASASLDKLQVHLDKTPVASRFKRLVIDFNGDGKINPDILPAGGFGGDGPWGNLYATPAAGPNDTKHHIHHLGLLDADGDPSARRWRHWQGRLRRAGTDYW